MYACMYDQMEHYNLPHIGTLGSVHTYVHTYIHTYILLLDASTLDSAILTQRHFMKAAELFLNPKYII